MMKMLPPLLKMLLIFVLLFTGVKIWYGRITDQLLPAEQPVTGPVAGAETTTGAETVALPQAEKSPEPLHNSPDYGIIVSRNIFEAQLDPVVDDGKKEEVKEEQLEETALRLGLLGTVSGNERDARAIIVDESKKQQDIYQVGDAVQRALIRAIERGKVVLEVNGRNEVLLIKDRNNQGGRETQTTTARSQPTVRRQPTVRSTVVTPQRSVNVRRAAIRSPQPTRVVDEVETDEDDPYEESLEIEEPVELIEPGEQEEPAEGEETAEEEEPFVDEAEGAFSEEVGEEITGSPEDEAYEPDE